MDSPSEISPQLSTFLMICSVLNTRLMEDLVLEVQDPNTAIIVITTTIIIIAQKANLNIQMLKLLSLVIKALYFISDRV